MTFSGDHLEPRSQWSKARSRTILGIVIFTILLLLADRESRGYALVGLALLITIMLHEAGHFLAAKWAKMKATEFFVGFGPRIWSFTKGETEYGIKAIPLGGYVKIIGMTNLDEVDEADEARTYRKGQTRKKLIVIMAGVTMNMILAYLLIFVSLVGHGVAKPPSDMSAKIETVAPESPAAKAGVKPGDVVTKVDGKKIATFEAFAETISQYEVGDKIAISVDRNGKSLTHHATLASGVDQTGRSTNKPMVGVTQAAEYERLGPVEAAKESGNAIWYTVKTAGSSMKRLFSPSGISSYSQTVVEGDYERQDRPSSIAGIVNIGGQMVNQDGWSLLWLVAVVNIFLALLNAVPLLPLDGGHAAVAIFERTASKIKKREVQADFRKLMPIAAVAIGILAIFSLSTLWLDILQIWS